MKNFYSFRLSTKVLAIVILLFSNSIISQDMTYNISDPEALEDQTYLPGDVIILADDTYTTDASISFVGNGTADKPITFRAATSGGVVFTNRLRLSIGGDYVIVDGFHWKGGYGASKVIEFRDGTDYANHSTIQNCAMDGITVHPDDDDDPTGTSVKYNWIHMYGTYNTVINCSFMNKSNAGNMILIDLYYNADNSCDIVGHTISNNYFYNFEKIDTNLTNAGDSETIRIGTSSDQMVNSSSIVSNNYFVSADGENEIITNKSKNNTYINNTFRKSRGSLVLRHGSHATVDGNYFLGDDEDGTGGIRIVDSEHTITNNYIQDCITVVDQAKWNNGITFLGGNETPAVPCDSGGSSSDYQKVENINVSNNTIINTNAPLFYNTDKGSTDPTGTVSNNLIYFSAGNANISDVITGDTPTSYADLGTALTYTGNVYTGTMLGETNGGFSEELGITATPDGEIFTFSGTGSTGKGADMGVYTPTTDNMVGHGIGACFLNNLGANITDGDCTIIIPESLTVSSLPTLAPEAGSYDVSVVANVSWMAASSDAWITTITPNSGSGDATVSVTVTENADTSSRSGSVTFTQDSGGDDIVRVLNVTQEGADLTDLYDLINDVAGGGPVSIYDFSQEEVDLDHLPEPKTNYATNTLDKDTGTRWAAEDGALVDGFKGDGEYVIYDLGKEYELDLIQIATDNKPDRYGIQIWVSTTGTDPSNFTTKVIPSAGDLQFTTTVGTFDDFDQYEISTSARYVKLMSFGRFNSAGDNRESAWTNITEIEFFGSESLSVDDADLQNNILLYPNPVRNKLNIKVQNDANIDTYKLHSIDGRLIMEEKIMAFNSTFNIDVSNLVSGMYILNLSSLDGKNITKRIIVSDR